MATALSIVGLSGSLRQGSFNTALLRAADALKPSQVKFTLLGIGDLPLFNQDQEQALPLAVQALKAAVKAADGVLIASPEYNYSVPGVLKNAIDWASRPYGDNAFESKPIAILGASTGALGTARMQYHLRQSFVSLNGFVMNRPEVLVPSAGEKFDASGALTDEKTKEKLQQMWAAFVQWIERVRE